MSHQPNEASTTRRLLLTLSGLLAVALLLFVGLPLWGGTAWLHTSPRTAEAPAPPPTMVGGKRLIILDHADILSHDQAILPDVVILSGNVRLRHGSWIMTCDSANLNEVTNSFDAFGHVRIQEGDSISITAGEMTYDGMTTLAELHDNVILTKNVTTLFTERLFYNRNQKVAYYDNFGTLADSINTLTSVYGEYNTGSDEALFQNQVHLENDRFTLDTDILHYNTKTSICRIVSPTIIETTDSVTIETDRGFYNTDTEQSILLDHSLVTHPDGTMTGDSILYDKKREICQAYYDVVIDNQKDKATYFGDYGYLDQANGYTYATGRAYVMDYSEEDTLYMSAEIMEGIKRNLPPPPGATDSLEVKYTKGYHNVRLYRKDIQAIGDSVHYFSLDSLIKLFGSPILWNDSTQLKGDTIYAHLANDTIDHAFAWLNASSVRWLDSVKQDRVKADTIQAYFREGTLDHAFYRSNVESRYYLIQEKAKHYYALAQVKNPQMDVYITDDKLDHILWHGKAEGTIHPIQDLTDALRQMSGAEWHGDKRPLSPEDVIPDRSAPPASTDSLATLQGQNSKMSKGFDGLAAWQAFYKEYKQAIEKPKPTEAKKTAPRDTTTIAVQPLSVYIRRPLESDTSSVPSLADSMQSYMHLLPLYSWDSYLDRENRAPSITNPSTGILRRSNSSDASSRSDESSKLPKTPTQQEVATTPAKTTASK
ncbi:OstA-like protein [uncultured Porphyromonas sp.]|uniref:OstA-like protein n=1 Tax=uncultured Porphyromonas sp. TaxID=159274 RepID=UPI002805D75C|nr:OstA-like protein [uncultured Porphyromonas sp.]